MTSRKGFYYDLLNVAVATSNHLSHNDGEAQVEVEDAQRRRSRVCSSGVLYNKEAVLFNVICTRQHDTSLLSRQSFDIPR